MLRAKGGGDGGYTSLWPDLFIDIISSPGTRWFCLSWCCLFPCVSSVILRVASISVPLSHPASSSFPPIRFDGTSGGPERGGEKRTAATSHPWRQRKAEDHAEDKTLVWKLISHPTALEYLRLFPFAPVWVYDKPAELVVAPFLSLLEFVQRLIFLH